MECTLKHRLALFYLRQLRRIWGRLPGGVRRTRAGREFGRHIDRVVRRHSQRNQHFATFFFRNRAELEQLKRLADQTPQGGRLDLAILACSKGAEVYSMAFIIRSARPDIELHIHALDISPEIVEFAARGIYSTRRPQPQDISTEDGVRQKRDVSDIPSSDQCAWIFERTSENEIESMFDLHGDEATVKPWVREGIRWIPGDVNDPAIASIVGPQDIVIANRFLCHMGSADATACLRKLDRFVRPGGYLFVCGVDLDVRTNVARERGWSPVNDLIREIHAADDLLPAWPAHYWGLEPLDDSRSDWQTRYSSVFRINSSLPVEEK